MKFYVALMYGIKVFYQQCDIIYFIISSIDYCTLSNLFILLTLSFEARRTLRAAFGGSTCVAS